MSFSNQTPPLFSIRSERGRRSKMEDNHDIRLNFMELPLDSLEMEDVIPKHLHSVMKPKSRTFSVSGDMVSCARSSKSGELCGPSERGAVEAFHLFSVFDGHGGDRAAAHCANKLAQNLKATITRALKKHALPIKEIVRHKTVPTHVLLAEAINLTELAGSDFEETETETETSPFADPSLETRSFASVEEEERSETDTLFSTMSMGLTARFDYANEQRSIQTLVSRHLDEMDLKSNGLTASQLVSCFNDAFVVTDNQFDREGGAEESGSTALTAMVSTRLLCFAHCGDCRGVLYRDGQILQVTREHSPESEDEKARIELLGGRIIAIRSDTPRVMGVLNMTRSIGDFGLKPFIIPNPEVTIMKRCMYDEFVVLASDGLWAVLDNQDVCELVSKCFARVEDRALGRHNASKVAANILTRKALDNGSPDNITVIVIDLRQYY